MEGKVEKLEYSDCHPTGAEIVQHITSGKPLHVTDEYHIGISTIIELPCICRERRQAVSRKR